MSQTGVPLFEDSIDSQVLLIDYLLLFLNLKLLCVFKVQGRNHVLHIQSEVGLGRLGYKGVLCDDIIHIERCLCDVRKLIGRLGC